MSVQMTHDASHGATNDPAGAVPGITAVRWSADGPSRSELPGSGGTMRHVVVKAGHVAPRHHHDFEQFLFVAEGSATLQCEQGTIPLEPGTALRLAPGTWHSAEFKTATVLIELNLDGPAP